MGNALTSRRTIKTTMPAHTNQSLHLEQTQKQTLTLAMRQSLHMLQLGTIELRHYIEELVSHNAVAELAPASAEAPDKEVTFRESREFASRHGLNRTTDGSVSDEQLMRDKKALESALHDLRLQAASIASNDRKKELLRYLIDSLDDNGYLTDDPAELASLVGVPLSLMKQAITVLKTMEPAGIGASGLTECLQLQLERLPSGTDRDNAIALLKADGLLERLARKQYREIGARLGISTSQAEKAGNLIRTLNPRPLNGSGHASPIHFIIPDFYILEDNGRIVCEMNSYYMPRIIIHNEYRDLPLKGEDAAFIKKNYEEAGNIVQFLEYRVSTLQKIVDYAIRVQEEFFREGPGHRKAMSNREIAEALSLSESTISRAVSGKYFDCQWGVYPLKYLFSHSISTGMASGADGGDSVDYDRVISALKELIKNESPSSPLSDQRLSELLTEQGIPVSRRTVAKYRQQQHIPNTSQRRVR